MKLAMTNFSLKRPWLVVLAVLLATGFFAVQFPKVKFDNDPENMLAEDEYIRIFHNQVKNKYSLYDFVIVGIVNNQHEDGVFNVETLSRIYRLTSELLSLHRNENGLPEIIRKNEAGEEQAVAFDLSPEGAWAGALAVAFRQDNNRLFDDEGNSAIIGREIISPSLVDNIKQAEFGSLKLEYLMERPPESREEALMIRNDAMSNPLYSGTLVSEDEKAICVYIPIMAKTYSYNVASLVRKLTEDWGGTAEVYITGQPVAQDTFGVEMLVQMATSAPLAGLAIFVLLLIFFKRLSLVIAPMIVAVVSVICTMGLLIGLGFAVHIMSSMIAIFLMPIAVADSVHILSEFFDCYHRFNDKRETVRHVITHLFRPMLYTSLTTIAGFASLAVTPIPPVRVFGLHVAFGVSLAWLLTMTLIPAYIMVAVPKRALDAIGKDEHREKQKNSRFNTALESLGLFSYRHWLFIVIATLLVSAVSVFGVTRIRVNDNPVKWFTKQHEIRVADAVLNSHFGGTYTAYLTLSGAETGAKDVVNNAAEIARGAQKRFMPVFPEATRIFLAKVDSLTKSYSDSGKGSLEKLLSELSDTASELDSLALASWNKIADEVNYMDAKMLSYDQMFVVLSTLDDVEIKDIESLKENLRLKQSLAGEELREAALMVCETVTSSSFVEYVHAMRTEMTAPLFKQPALLSYIEGLQAHILTQDAVGKTSSAVDALKKASYELSYVPLDVDSNEADEATAAVKNEMNRAVPDTSAAVGQVFTQLEGMKKKDSLFHLVSRDYEEANIWVQLKSGDNVDMQAVVADLEQYMSENPPPRPLEVGWAGLTYLNVVWQDKMVTGMFSSLASSFIVVLVMMVVLFRSPLYGVLSMIPLSVTILFIYGLIGIVGKDYDMPVAILSALTLGLSVDFAIHFLERVREEQKKCGSWRKASAEMFKEPAVAISRNAITISIGFTPLLLATLVPYRTVGFFLATIMGVSWMATLFILPALLTMLRKYTFKGGDDE